MTPCSTYLQGENITFYQEPPGAQRVPLSYPSKGTANKSSAATQNAHRPDVRPAYTAARWSGSCCKENACQTRPRYECAYLFCGWVCLLLSFCRFISLCIVPFRKCFAEGSHTCEHKDKKQITSPPARRHYTPVENS